MSRYFSPRFRRRPRNVTCDVHSAREQSFKRSVLIRLSDCSGIHCRGLRLSRLRPQRFAFICLSWWFPVFLFLFPLFPFPALIRGKRLLSRLSIPQIPMTFVLPGSLFRFPFSVFCFTIFPEAFQPRRVEVWGWILKSRVFESCSRPWNRCFPESSIFLHMRLTRVG